MNLLSSSAQSFGDIFFSKEAIIIYIAITVVIFVSIIIMAIREEAKSEERVVHNVELSPDFNFSGMPASNKKEEEEGGSRFYTLSSIDANKAKYQKGGHNEKISLREFCEDFRNFAGSKLKLYYSIDDIRRFIAGMAVSKIVILQGMSGTGKTSLAFAMGEFLSNPSSVIPVQPMWKERTDLVGYYNEFTKRFNETTLLQKMYEANYSKDIYVTILDEFNIARVEYYFAEFLSLLEIPDPERRNLDVVSDEWENDPIQLNEGRMKLPNNMWFIGTANNDDSTFAISDKVYDRAMIMNLDKKCEPFRAPKTKGVRITAERFMKMAEDAVREYSISKRNEKRLEKLDEYMVKVFHITFGNRIMKQIRTYIPIYVACGGEELEALDDILSKKVLRKLETQNPVYIRSVVDGFCDYLDELFGYDKMKLCKEYVQFIKKNV
ncbi:MAG: AAA family ATPase [Clostridia bacterium]|nr:AAA family ATPase [Clostridia bacterium]